MNIPVEYLDQHGNIHNLNYQLTRLAFAKHMTMAGQGYILNPGKLIKSLAKLVNYSAYMQRRPFYQNNRFSEPPMLFRDPTEKGQFSNLAGKAIADFLSKRIDNSFMTINYEGAMSYHKQPIRGSRPDLIAFSPNTTFAIEAKGREQSVISTEEMAKHKKQSQSGPFSNKVHFSIACISYNLYRNIAVKYHDPFNEGAEYDLEALKALSKKYYSSLAEFLNENSFNVSRTQIQNENFFEVGLSGRTIEKLFDDGLMFDRFGPAHFYFDRVRLLLPADIIQYAEEGITKELEPFNLAPSETDSRYLYIDNDRVGLRFW